MGWISSRYLFTEKMQYVFYDILDLTTIGFRMIISVLHDQGGISIVVIEISPNSSESIDLIELI